MPALGSGAAGRFESPFGPLAYETGGTGTPVLLVHSVGTSRRMWRDVVPRLPEARWVVPDLLGHGESGPPHRDVTLPEHADALVATMDHLGIETFSYVGTSMGGLIGIDLAARYPERVRALVLNGCPGWHLEAQRVSRMITLGRLVGPDGLPAPDAVPGGTVRPRTEQQIAERREDLARTGRFFLSSMWAMAAFDPMTRLSRITARTLVLMGDGDFHLPTSYTLSDGIRHAVHEVLPQAGHLTPYDDPEAVGNALSEFLSVGPASAR